MTERRDDRRRSRQSRQPRSLPLGRVRSDGHRFDRARCRTRSSIAAPCRRSSPAPPRGIARPWVNLKTTVGGDYTNIEDDLRVRDAAPCFRQAPSSSTKRQHAPVSMSLPVADKTLGVYAQEVVGLRDRLFLTAAVRSDQNSAFGTKFQNVLYPKASVSWLISDESFFPKFGLPELIPSPQRLWSERCAAGSHRRLDHVFTAGNQNLPSRAAGSTAGTDAPALAAKRSRATRLRSRALDGIRGRASRRRCSRTRSASTTRTYLKKTNDALISVDIAPSSAASRAQPAAQHRLDAELRARAAARRRSSSTAAASLGRHAHGFARVEQGARPRHRSRHGPSAVSSALAARRASSSAIRSTAVGIAAITYGDANGDGVLQNERSRRSTRRSATWAIAFPRDIFSIQNGDRSLQPLAARLRRCSTTGGWHDPGRRQQLPVRHGSVRLP